MSGVVASQSLLFQQDDDQTDPWITLFDASEQGTASLSNFTLDDGRNFRQRITTDFPRLALSQIRITYQAGNLGLIVTSATVGKVASGDDFDGTQVYVTFNGGDSGFSIGAGETIVSDPVRYSFLETDNLLFALYTPASPDMNAQGWDVETFEAPGSDNQSFIQTVGDVTINTSAKTTVSLANFGLADQVVAIRKIETNDEPLADTFDPIITSEDAATVDDEATLSHALTANESVTWSIVGGADQAQFELSGSTLRWVSNGTQDYEAPADADTDNDYIVTVRATDTSGNTTDQTITVTVTGPNVVLLAVWDGADGNTVFSDVGPNAHTMTTFGDAQTDTGFTIFSEQTLLVDGTGDYVTASDGDDLVFTPGPFTIEFWVRPDVSTASIANFGVIGHADIDTAAWNFTITYGVTSATQKRFEASFHPAGTFPGTSLTQALTNIDHSVAHHVCLERNLSNKLRLYVDGVMRASATGISGAANPSTTLKIGSNGSTSNKMKGWFSPVRIINGEAIYDSDSGFTPPTGPFPRP